MGIPTDYAANLRRMVTLIADGASAAEIARARDEIAKVIGEEEAEYLQTQISETLGQLDAERPIHWTDALYASDPESN